MWHNREKFWKGFHQLTRYRAILIQHFIIHDDAIKRKLLPCYWPFLLGINRSPVKIPLTKTKLCGLWCFFDVGPHRLLIKQSSDWWFETTWRFCDVIVMYNRFPTVQVIPNAAAADGDEQRYKTSKTQVAFFVLNCDYDRIEIDHLYGLCYRGWYCYPTQHSLCRPARPRTDRHNSCCAV